jgi:hypothetical protein
VVKHTTLFAALGCVALAAILTGCGAVQGTTNHLQSIQLSTSNTSESAPGTLILEGEGGTLQLYTWGNYSNGKSQLLSGEGIVYQISITAGSVDQFDDPLPTPPQTVLMTANGLLTAVPPFICTFQNSAVPPATAPAWGLSGSYSVTSTSQGLTSPPAYIAVASQAGIYSTTNPTSACGPSPTS